MGVKGASRRASCCGEREPCSRRPSVYTGVGVKVRIVGWGGGGRGGSAGDREVEETRALWDRNWCTSDCCSCWARAKDVTCGRCTCRRIVVADIRDVVGRKREDEREGERRLGWEIEG